MWDGPRTDDGYPDYDLTPEVIAKWRAEIADTSRYTAFAPEHVTKMLDRIEDLTAENERLLAIVDADATFSDLEVKIRDGSFDLRAVAGEEGGQPAARMLAALMLNVILGDESEPVEPPNYRSCELALSPAGEVGKFRAVMEVIKIGGRSSHEIRRDLEAENERLRAALASLWAETRVTDRYYLPDGLAGTIGALLAESEDT